MSDKWIITTLLKSLQLITYEQVTWKLLPIGHAYFYHQSTLSRPERLTPAAILSSTEVEMVTMEVKSGWWQTTAHTRKKDRRSWRQDMVKRCCGQIKGDRLLRSRVSYACRPSDHHCDHYPYALFSRHVSATQLELRCREISITCLTWYCLFAHIFISCFMS